MASEVSHMVSVPTGSGESKLGTFQGPFLDQTRYFKDPYEKFHDADMLKMYYFNEELVPHNCSEKSIPLNWMIAIRHQAISWTNVDCSSMTSCSISLRTVSHEILKTANTVTVSWNLPI